MVKQNGLKFKYFARTVRRWCLKSDSTTGRTPVFPMKKTRWPVKPGIRRMGFDSRLNNHFPCYFFSRGIVKTCRPGILRQRKMAKGDRAVILSDYKMGEQRHAVIFSLTKTVARGHAVIFLYKRALGSNCVVIFPAKKLLNYRALIKHFQGIKIIH